jgi:hypothetical protein
MPTPIGACRPADLAIAVNPAADSVLARQMIAALYSRKTERTRPLFVSITSMGDWNLFPDWHRFGVSQ